MTIIQIKSNESGQRAILSRSGKSHCWIDGFIEVPKRLEAKVWATKGWCNTIIENDKLVDVVPTERPETKEDIKERIAEIEAKLSATDYKIIKCYEYQLVGLDLPYNISELHTERQSLRDEINALEEKL